VAGTSSGEVCYLLAFPAGAGDAPAPAGRIERLKDAPAFEVIDLDVRTVAHEQLNVGGVAVAIRRQVYDGRIALAECRFALPDVLAADAIDRQAAVAEGIRARLLAAPAGPADETEAYTILLLGDVGEAPDAWVERHGQALARFVRGHETTFERQAVAEALVSRVRYSDRHLTVIDWEGAVVIAPDGDFHTDVELLKIGTYQVLRYRLLDAAIEASLQSVSRHLKGGARPSLLPTASSRALHQALEQRLALMLDFERVDQRLLLIGDWYAAQVYRAVYDEFYLDEWKAAIKEKLASLESVAQIIQDNFEFSWQRILDLTQTAGWLVLLIGYFVLFYLEVGGP
jgi:hypothetical protein